MIKYSITVMIIMRNKVVVFAVVRQHDQVVVIKDYECI